MSTPGTIAGEVFTESAADGYARLITLRDGDVLCPLHVPIEVPVVDIPR